MSTALALKGSAHHRTKRSEVRSTLAPKACHKSQPLEDRNKSSSPISRSRFTTSLGALPAAKGFEAMSTDSLASVVGEIVAANPAEWGKYVAGDEKLVQFFVGQVMKSTKGKADGKAVSAELRRLRG